MIRPESWAISKLWRLAWEHGRASRPHTREGYTGTTLPKGPKPLRSVHPSEVAIRKVMCRKWYPNQEESREGEGRRQS